MSDEILIGNDMFDLAGSTSLPQPDMLQELFQMQYNLTNRYMVENYDVSLKEILSIPFDDARIFEGPSVREQLLVDTCNFIAEEAFELKRNFNYKSWKKYKKVNEEAAREELVDIWHFLLQATIEMGFTPESLMAQFRAKNQTNHARQDSGTY